MCVLKLGLWELIKYFFQRDKNVLELLVIMVADKSVSLSSVYLGVEQLVERYKCVYFSAD